MAPAVAGAARLGDLRALRSRPRVRSASASVAASIFVADVMLSALLMGLEASSLRRWTLSRGKWRQLDVVVADEARCRRAPLLRALEPRSSAASSTINGPSIAAAAADPQRAGSAILKSAAASARRHHRLVSRTGRVTMSVAIIDYGSGNLHSAAKAFERAARSLEDPPKILVTSDPDRAA